MPKRQVPKSTFAKNALLPFIKAFQISYERWYCIDCNNITSHLEFLNFQDSTTRFCWLFMQLSWLLLGYMKDSFARCDNQIMVVFYPLNCRKEPFLSSVSSVLKGDKVLGGQIRWIRCFHVPESSCFFYNSFWWILKIRIFLVHWFE